MSKTISPAPFEVAQIQEHLRRVLASKAFEQSSRSARFLAFVVEAVLAGQGGQLKESAIGVSVFDRDPSYNPKVDPVVRNAARRLRNRLEQYYAEEGVGERLRILLPKGGYSPQFEIAAPGEGVSAAPAPALTDTTLLPTVAKPTLLPTVAKLTLLPTVARLPVNRRFFYIGIPIAVLAAVFVVALKRPGVPAGPPHVEPLSTYPGRTFQPAISPDGKHLAFVWDGGIGNYDIYLKALDGAAVRFTTDPAHDLHPAWSPDGERVAFLRASRESLDIMLSHVLDRSERRLTQLHGLYYGHWEPDAARMLGNPGPVWSPDGKYLAVTSTSGSEANGAACSLYSVTVETGEKRKITNPPGDAHDFYPAFSPDGAWLAFARYESHSAADIYLIPARGGAERRLTDDHRDIAGLTWTADGRALIFSSNRSGLASLWKIPSAGGAPSFIPASGRSATEPTAAITGGWLAYTDSSESVNLWRLKAGDKAASAEKLISSSRQTYGARYSPDGTKLAFVSNRGGSWEIWTSRADGSDLEQITKLGSAWVGSPHWSPDGQWVVFDSRVDGHSAIFVTGAEGGKPRRLLVDQAEEKMPSWSHDGQWIYFSSNRLGQAAIWKVPVAGGVPQQISDLPGYDSLESADGKTVYFLNRTPGVWEVPASGGKAKLLKGLEGVFPNLDWAVTSRGIFFVDQAVRLDRILFYRFSTGAVEPVASLDGNVESGVPALELSPDERWIVYARPAERQSDLMMLRDW